MNALLGMLAAAGLGVFSMYIFDPLAGRRRRALARDKLTRVQSHMRQTAGVTARDLKNRTLGFVAEGRAAIFGGAVDDAVLAERVRSKLGFLVRHPSAIEIQVNAGRVTLSGPVLSDEVQQLTRGVASVRGVRALENRLEVHEKGDDVPGLQGDAQRPNGQTIDVLQRRWSPSTRFLLGTAGMLLLFGINPFRKSTALLSALAGLGLLAYGLTEGETEIGPADDSRYAEASAGWEA
jgi:BON domain